MKNLSKQSIPQLNLFLYIYLFTLIFRIIFASQIGLIDDGAYHWSWSQHLQFSYFDHPGFIAWCEWLSTALLGNTHLGVRLPAMIFYGLTAFFVWKLARDLFNKESAHMATLLFLWSPFYGFGGHVASPEPPFMFFWVLSSWIFWQGVREDEHRWSLFKTWFWLGITMGLGLNSKFITVLLAPGFALYMLFNNQHRKDLLTPWPWMGAGIATLLSFPIFYWNWISDWPSFKYQFHDRHAHTAFSFLRWLEFLGAQLLFYSPFLYVLILFVFVYALFQRKKNNWLFIFSLSAPALCVFYPQPLYAEYKPHWTGAAILILIIGVAGALNQGVISKKNYWIRSISAFFILFAFVTYSPFVYPWIPKVYRKLTTAEWSPRMDLSNEFFGWRELGAHLHQLQDQYKDTLSGTRPFLSSQRYETTAQVYWGAQEKTYMLGTPVSHYTVLQHQEGINHLFGKNTLFVSTDKYPEDPQHQAHFSSCQKLPDFQTYRVDELSRTFYIYYCQDFQGIIGNSESLLDKAPRQN